MAVASVITNTGLAKFTAARLGQIQPIQFAEIVFGNGDPVSNDGYLEVVPDPNQVSLVNQLDSIPVDMVLVAGPTTTIGGVLPNDHGDYWGSEAGVKDTEGDLLIVASIPPFQKLAGTNFVLSGLYRFPVTIANADQIIVTTDPSATFVTFADLIAATEGMVREVRRGQVTLAINEETKTVPLAPAIDATRSYLNMNAELFVTDSANIQTSTGGSILNDGSAIEFRRPAPAALLGPVTINWEVVIHGSLVAPQ